MQIVFVYHLLPKLVALDLLCQRNGQSQLVSLVGSDEPLNLHLQDRVVRLQAVYNEMSVFDLVLSVLAEDLYRL